jgi:hypothetical protein
MASASGSGSSPVAADNDSASGDFTMSEQRCEKLLYGGM